MTTDKPLPRFAKFAIIGAAALAILLFYLFACVSILLLLVFLAGELIAFVALLRFGMSRLIAPFIERHTRLLLLFARSAWIRTRTEFRVPLAEADAPRLFQFLNQLSQRLKVPPPKGVLIEMNAGAWVHLRGLRRGANATTLGLGYDLLAALTEREVEAVLAHEMTHAKFVRRGVKRWLNGGVARAASLANGLSAVVEAYRRANQKFELGEWLLAGADRCARMAVRMVAAYSRQDEFEADRGAAEICGSAPLRTSLTKLDLIATKTARIAWRERVARLQSGAGFGHWLAEELRVAVTTTVSTTEVHDPYSTHPSLNDRIAALPVDDSGTDSSPSAIALFANPDEVAKRLVTEIHRVAVLEEKRDMRERLRWLRKLQRGVELRWQQMPGIILVLIGLIAAIFAWADTFSLLVLVIGIALMVGGVVLYRVGRYRDRLELPVPEFEMLKAAWDKPDDPETRESREKALLTEIDQNVAGLGKKARRAQLRAAAVSALGQCDYLRAFVVARKSRELDKRSPESLLLAAIASAGLQLRPQAIGMLDVAAKRTGVRTPAMLWGFAWALTLAGEWASAEPMLEQLRRRDPPNATFAALQAICQARRNKLQTAIDSARTAFARGPQRKEKIELLADLLLAAGYLAEAEQLLGSIGPALASQRDLELLMIRLKLLQRDFSSADAAIQRLRRNGVDGNTCVELGVLNETARRDAQAVAFYEEALTLGFYPAAELGLARLCFHRGDKVSSRHHALAALNTERKLGDKADGPLTLFSDVLGQLLQLEEPIANANAWLVTLSGNEAMGVLANRSFLIFAVDANAADRFVRTVAEATQPGKPPLLPVYLSVRKAPSDRHPVGAVRPGIQSFWRG